MRGGIKLGPRPPYTTVHSTHKPPSAVTRISPSGKVYQPSGGKGGKGK